MLFSDTYKTISGISEATFSVKGSKFIAYIHPLASDSVLKEVLNQIKFLHPKASHYCWAFRLSQDRSVFRVNDDGEPSGTAGKPILNALLSNDLTNVLVVVVRYFGGTLLGVPGLINAYKQATLAAIQSSVIIEVALCSIYQVKFEHPQLNEVMKIIKDEEIKVRQQLFDNICIMQLEIRNSVLEGVINRLRNIRTINIKYISSP